LNASVPGPLTGSAIPRANPALHTSTVSGRFGWHRDGWHGPGRMRQHNSWETDGHEFYARHRILRWLPESLVEAEFDHDERRAVERLCAAFPELIPAHPASLTRGDLWIVRKLIAPFRHNAVSRSTS
jgi:fructosamine-3-kinase